VAGVLVADDSVIRRADGAGLTKLRSGLDLGDGASERTLHNQIAAYAEVLDKAAPQLEELKTGEGEGKLRSVRWQAGPVLTTFVVGMLVIGGALIVRSNRSPAAVDVVDGSSTTVAAAALPAVDVGLVNRSAITPEMFSDWEYQFAGPGAVMVVDGRYHMLSAAYGDDVATVAYAVSDDGVVWRQAENYPVLDLSEVPWAPLEIDQAAPRSVIVDRDGSWQLFFDVVWYDRGADELRASIGRVVARDPAGTWIYDSAPIITRNEGFPWMAERVSSPSVVVRDGRLVMLFVGEGPEGGVVGIAESQNGAGWSVRPEPAYTASGNWDGGNISQVDLMVVPGGMAMFYAGESASRRGLAVSSDGVGWAPHPSNPLLTSEDVSAAALFDAEFLSDGTNVLAYVENGQTRGPREVAVLRLTLDISNLIDALLGP